mgnify:CR=1 FL=1
MFTCQSAFVVELVIQDVIGIRDQVSTSVLKARYMLMKSASTASRY